MAQELTILCKKDLGHFKAGSTYLMTAKELRAFNDEYPGVFEKVHRAGPIRRDKALHAWNQSRT